jgi:hypothetical protein
MGNVLNETTLKEHRDDLPIKGKRVFPYGIDGADVSMIKVDTEGNIYTVDNSGMLIPKHDKQVINEASAPATTIITYSLNSVDVATKTITVSGTTTTIEMTYA